ncbi:hypothetical protein SNE40_016833 [Patella caerulea]|uniref:Cadherin domain-containing protein n=1 Tax=Patella caerulea TaxID=87958 RepID=A0AAN8JAR3_PATCE
MDLVNLFLSAVLMLTPVYGDILYTLLEEKPAGFFIGKISDIADLQSTVTETALITLRYSFLTQGYPQSKLFNLTKDGQLYTAVKLDREDVCGFSDTCVLETEIAIQSTINQFFRKEKLKVTLEDINDNAPTFNKDSLTLEISEAVSVNSSFILESALDRDVGNNSLQGYDLISDSDIFDLKVVKNLDGGTVVSLVVLSSLDHEVRDLYTLTVVARDGGVSPRKAELKVIVSVLDINDNSPVFDPQAYNITVKESTAIGETVVQVTATDLDAQLNGVAYYRFSPLVPSEVLHYFALNESTGKITVFQSLHLVQGQMMRFIVECVDGGSPPLVAQTEVIISIEDSTNTPPTINLNLFADGKVSEFAQPGTTVAHVAVLDPDSSKNGIIRCFIISDAFEIQGLEQNDYKIVVSRTLDRENSQFHRVVLTCEDAGNPPMNDTKVFSIAVLDENDNAPFFKQFDYLGNITENTEPGQVIAKVEAVDMDDGENSKIYYYIPLGDEYGVKIRQNGEIISEKTFDREKTPKLKFKVFATDHGRPSRNSSCTVTIIVTDVNDVVPTFSQSRYTFKAKENQESGVVIGRLEAKDADEGLNSEILYNIQLLFDELEYYPIKVTTDGFIQTAFSLDREIKSSYQFVVVASDRGSQPLSSSTEVIIEVTDQNDHAPSIVSPSSMNHSMMVPYHMHTDYALFTVLAKDEDVGENAHLEFILQPENGHGIFKIDSVTGVIRLSRFLDGNDVGTYQIHATVRDMGTPSLNTSVDFNITIYKSNETNTYLQQGLGSEENTMVVLILGSVTGIIVVVVIIVILIIRRSDQANQKFFQANVITHIEPDNLQLDCSMEDLVDHRRMSKADSNSWEKRSNIFPGSDDLVSLSEVEIEQSTKNRENVQGAWNEAMKKHEALLKSYGLPTKVQVRRGVTPVPVSHQEETGSHTSADTSTNDSGRGGSDDEGNHLNRSNLENGSDVNQMAVKKLVASDSLLTCATPNRRMSDELGIGPGYQPSTVLRNPYTNMDINNSFTKRVKFNLAENKPWLTTPTGNDPALARHRCHGNLTDAQDEEESCDSEVDSIISDVHVTTNGKFDLQRQKTEDVYV